MNDKNIEQMKKIIEEKKSRTQNDSQLRPTKTGGESKRKAFKNKKTGGVFDK